MEYNEKINLQYGDGSIKERINKALSAANRKFSSITLKELSYMDELHMGGGEATIKLANAAKLFSGARLLDAGSGLGGPARILAAKFNCIVTGIDLTEEFCNTAAMLTKLAEIDSNKVSFICGDACNAPFKNESFDIVWSQHSSMNIEDKIKLYSEYKRVLKKGGLLIIHDAVSEPNKSLYYPTPWANEPSISFLITEEKLISILTGSGFEKIYLSDISEETINWYKKLKQERKSGNIPILGPHIVFGSAISVMASNMRKNLIEKRVKVVETIWRK
ncbi:MAG: methyltransferase domain-containing protein [Deltaproteobacteria bacterium]|nr:methyltransferase domain-containing protein [Deltaproteobacteria bacterium]